MSEEINTTRLILKTVLPKDIGSVAQAAGATDTDRITKLIQQSAAWWKSYGYGVWKLLDAESENCLGWCGLRPGDSHDAPELFYGLAPTSRGKGLATEAGLAVLDFAFKNDGISSVWAATEYTNAASIAVMRRMGMEFENRTDLDGVDSVIYRIGRSRYFSSNVEHSRTSVE